MLAGFGEHAVQRDNSVFDRNPADAPGCDGRCRSRPRPVRHDRQGGEGQRPFAPLAGDRSRRPARNRLSANRGLGHGGSFRLVCLADGLPAQPVPCGWRGRAPVDSAGSGGARSRQTLRPRPGASRSFPLQGDSRTRQDRARCSMGDGGRAALRRPCGCHRRVARRSRHIRLHGIAAPFARRTRHWGDRLSAASGRPDRDVLAGRQRRRLALARRSRGIPPRELRRPRAGTGACGSFPPQGARAHARSMGYRDTCPSRRGAM